MKTILRINLLLLAAGISALSAKSQSDRLAYAVTDTVGQVANWNFLRIVDTKTGAYSNVLATFLNASDTNDIFPGNTVPGRGIAAIAHDKKNKRLYYTPMLIDRLSYIDLKTMKTHIVTNNFTGMRQKAADQGNIFTRMVIADDNNGYALTNDGRHLVRFTTDNNPVIVNLGSLADAPGNGEISVHNGCSSFGGDIISDDENNLYLVTLRNHVFKINIQNKIAAYLGTVTGLPADFTTSSLAVDHLGTRLIIISPGDAPDIYSVDPVTLMATAVNAAQPKHTADLANTSLLRTKKMSPPAKKIVSATRVSNEIQLYPNPVTSNEFTIRFTNAGTGNYTVDVIDGKGQAVVSKPITIVGKTNAAVVKLPGLTAKGIFIVRITDRSNKTIFSDKIIVQ